MPHFIISRSHPSHSILKNSRCIPSVFSEKLSLYSTGYLIFTNSYWQLQKAMMTAEIHKCTIVLTSSSPYNLVPPSSIPCTEDAKQEYSVSSFGSHLFTIKWIGFESTSCQQTPQSILEKTMRFLQFRPKQTTFSVVEFINSLPYELLDQIFAVHFQASDFDAYNHGYAPTRVCKY